MRIFKTIIIILILAPTMVYGIGDKAGTTGLKFLTVGAGARQSVVGAVPGDINSLFYNPAAVYFIENPAFGLSHNKWITDIVQQTAAGFYPTKYGNFGLGIQYLSVGEIKGYDVDTDGEPIRIPNFNPYDATISLNYSKKIINVPMGINLKIFREKIEEVKAEGVALDIGVYKNITDSFSGALSVINIGPKVKYIKKKESLPMEIKIGGRYALFDKSLNLYLNLNKPLDNKIETGFSAEYFLKKILCLRAGYLIGNDYRKGLSSGLGININDFDIDYAFIPYKNLGNNHRVSLTVKFGKEEDEEEERLKQIENRIDKKLKQLDS
nr:PorV/PorQ family protein [Elusimicrobiota bacterium]